MNHKLKKLLFVSSLVTGTTAGILFNNSSADVHAENVYIPDGRMYLYNLPDGRIIEDSLGPFSINGRWVFCIEPFIWTKNDTHYVSNGEIMNQNVISRVDAQGTQFTLNDNQKLLAATIPYMLLEMPVSDFDLMMESAESWNSGMTDPKYRSVKASIPMLKELATWVRRQPDYVRYSTVQMFYWQFVLDGQNIQSPETIRPHWTSPVGTNQAYINDVNNALALNGAPEIVRSFDNPVWLMNRYHHALHWLNFGFYYDSLSYLGGAQLYTGTVNTAQGDLPQKLVSGLSGRFTVKAPRPKEAYIKINKSLIDFIGVNPITSWNWDGIKVGVYTDEAATNRHGIITINSFGTSSAMKLDPDTDYWLYELDNSGQPIKSDGQKPFLDRSFTGGKFDGQLSYGMKINIPGGQNMTADDARVLTLRNVPEVVNISFTKKSNSPVDTKSDKQYSIEGAEYTLYRTRQDAESKTNPLVTVSVDADGNGRFENLTRYQYFARETKPPTINTTSGKKFTHEIDNTIYEINTLTGGVRDASVSTDATGSNFPVTEYSFDKAYTSIDELPKDTSRTTFYKLDKESNSSIAKGWGTLTGAEYKVEFYDPAVLNEGRRGNLSFSAIYKTDENGQLNIYDKNFVKQDSILGIDAFNRTYKVFERTGKWTFFDMVVTEVKAPQGYHLNETPIDIPLELEDVEALQEKAKTINHQEDDLELTIVKRQKVENEWQTNTNLVLPGTKFRLTNKTSNQTTDLTVGNDGKATFKGLSHGDYELREIEAPTGYQINKQVIQFTVGENSKITSKSTSIETDDDGNYRIDWEEGRVSPHTGVKEDIDVLVDNIPTRATAKVVKVNEKNEPLKGATFTLTHLDDNGQPVANEEPVRVTTDERGIANFEGLIIGDYYTMEETKAPVGYKLPRDKQVVKFRAESTPILDTFNVTYEFDVLDQYDTSNTTHVKKAGKLTKDSNSMSLTNSEKVVNGLSYTVDANEQMHLEFNQVNHTWQKLPATGSNLAVIGGAVAMTLVFAGSVGVIAYKRRSE